MSAAPAPVSQDPTSPVPSTPVPDSTAPSTPATAPAAAPTEPHSTPSTAELSAPASVAPNNNNKIEDVDSQLSLPQGPVQWGLTPEEAEKWVAARHQRVPLSLVTVDRELRFGQPRPVDQQRVDDLVAGLEGTPLLDLKEGILLIRAEVGDAKYVVLGGQHTCLALQALWAKADKARREPCPWMKAVYADILHAGTPPSVARRAAGTHQWVQTGAQPLPLHQWCGNLLMTEASLPILERLKLATEWTGHARPKNQVWCRFFWSIFP